MRYDRAINTKDVLIFLMIFVISLGIGSFFDLKIASLITYEGNIYSRAVNAFGIYPFTLAISVFGTLIISSRNYASRAKSMFQLITGLLIVGGAMALSWYYTYKYLPELDIHVNIAIAVILNALAGLFMYKQTSNAIVYEVKNYLTVLALSVVINMILAYTLRFVLYRPTYLEVLKGVEYSPWYFTKLGITMNSSLPVIPVVSAVSLTTFTLFGKINRSFRYADRFILFVMHIVILGVSVACLVSGEHYLSDVSLSVLVPYLIEWIIISAVYGN